MPGGRRPIPPSEESSPVKGLPASVGGAGRIATRDRARRMRITATLLLVAMAGVFVAARQFEGVHPAVGYVVAFAEAAMVGGLADWFAVTALFRHPLGLPIPHTAIIPRNKDRIGQPPRTLFLDAVAQHLAIL